MPGRPKAVNVTPLADYRLLLEFETGERRVLDITPHIRGSWFGQLKDVDFFNSVRIVNDTVEWPGGQDLSPDEIYDASIPESPQTVKELRLCMGMTQKEFSKYFKINHRTLQRWEADPEMIPSYLFHLMLYKYENELAKGNLVAH